MFLAASCRLFFAECAQRASIPLCDFWFSVHVLTLFLLFRGRYVAEEDEGDSEHLPSGKWLKGKLNCSHGPHAPVTVLWSFTVQRNEDLYVHGVHMLLPWIKDLHQVSETEPKVHTKVSSVGSEIGTQKWVEFLLQP